ncbi:hypothetical protein JYU34_003057 [Plutella xylostella]|uniref:Gamma-butyrobetaine dioxygenase n=1 Tax=Plutella xylostella TaxID=51655 RepID=A0ABQ7QZ53_PLUXY|nr:hypothetical protein JYU34_003057 [Plutella xylostella]
MFALKRIINSELLSTAVTKCKSSVTKVQRIHSVDVLAKKTGNEIVSLDIHGERLKFPAVWLRDNCQCAQCYHPSARSRTIDWATFNLQVRTTRVTTTDHSVHIAWSDGHRSEFKKNWLKIRSFIPEHQKKYTDTVYKPPKVTWHGDEFPNVFTKHDYNELLTSDKALHDFLHQLSVHGVALVENAPDSELALTNFISKVGFPKQTHYGIQFVVKHVPNTSNVAYLSSNLQVHTDLPYYEYCPGVNMLHCLVQTESNGGENVLSDGHYVAHYMKKNYPEQYRLLTEVEVEWKDVGVEFGNEFFKLHRSPIICLDKHGEISRINFSIPQRGSNFIGKIEDVNPWYEAHTLFMELNLKFSAKFRTKPGNILAFDNIRLLHGRNAYEDSPNNVRQIFGQYIDWDEIYSRLRCLKVKLDKDDSLI